MFEFLKDVITEVTSILPPDPHANAMGRKSPMAAVSKAPIEHQLPSKVNIKSVYEWETQSGQKLRMKIVDIVDKEHAIYIEMWNTATPNKYMKKIANLKQIQYLLKTAKSWKLVSDSWTKDQ